MLSRMKRVIGRMKLDDIEPMALGIEQAQLGRIFIGKPRLLEHMRGAPSFSEPGQGRDLGVRAVRVDRVLQRAIATE